MIVVADYDPEWPVRFSRLKREYAGAMATAGVPIAGIEHVGSTSVPGLAAKPIIDCDIIVAAEDVDAASAVLISLGFTPMGDLGVPMRWAFREPERFARTNTYIVISSSLALKNHLAVRDALRGSPALREKYAAVKKRIGATAAGIDEYGRGKNAVVREILAAAGLSESERASIAANQLPAHDDLPG